MTYSAVKLRAVVIRSCSFSYIGPIFTMLLFCGSSTLVLLVCISYTLAVPLSDFYSVDGGASVTGDDGFSYPQRTISPTKKIPFFGTLYDFIVVS